MRIAKQPMAESSKSQTRDPKMMREAIVQVQLLLGYKLSNEALLKEALTHSSCTDYPSYKRLVLVGDAALTLAIVECFFLTKPQLSNGMLTNLRKVNTKDEKLARVAVRHGLYRLLRRDNTPDLDKKVDEFTRQVKKEKEDDYGVISYGGSTFRAPEVLADMVRSIAAAVYIDCNMDLKKFWKVFRVFLEPIITPERWQENPKTMLQEHCQKHGWSVDYYEQKDYTITTNVVVGKLVGVASSTYKEIAELNAARNALSKFLIVHTNHPAEVKEGSKQNTIDMPFYKRRGLWLILCVICYLVFCAHSTS